MAEQNNENLELEVSSIYTAIVKYEDSVVVPLFEKPSLKHPQSRRILSRYILSPLLVFGVFSIIVPIIGWPWDFIKFAFLLLLLVWYVVLPILQIMELYAERGELSQFFKNSNKVIFEGMSHTITADCLLVQALKCHSAEALQLVKNRMLGQQGAIETRLGTLVGALDKLGIVPGLITLFLAASSKQNELVTLLIAIVVFILYLFAFTIHFSLPRLGFYEKLIESEIQRKCDDKS